jgi:hypothetical protein
MAILRIAVNDREIVCAGGDRFCSLNWDIRASLLENDHAVLDVSGLAEREPSVYDAAYWLEGLPLKPGDRVLIESRSDVEATTPIRWHTHEENEALRLEVARAEAAHEYDAARVAPRPRVRTCAKLALIASTGSRVAEAGKDGESVVCSGAWTNHHRTSEWLVRLTGYGANANRAPGQWLPIAGGVVVEIAA